MMVQFHVLLVLAIGLLCNGLFNEMKEVCDQLNHKHFDDDPVLTFKSYLLQRASSQWTFNEMKAICDHLYRKYRKDFDSAF